MTPPGYRAPASTGRAAPVVRRGVLRVLVALAAGLLLVGCQVRIGTEVDVATDGSGRLALTVALDRELAGYLEDADIDLSAELDDLEGWQVTTTHPDDGLRLELGAPFADPAGLGRRVAQLRDAFPTEQPVLLDRLSLEVAGDGAVRLDGSAGLRLPSAVDASGYGVAVDGQEVRRRLAADGERLARVELRVHTPGPVQDTDADRVRGGSATWRLPVGERRPLHLVSGAAESPELVTLVLVAGIGAVLAGGVALLGLRRYA